MSQYTLVESRDPFAVRPTEHLRQIAVDLADAGNQVSVLFVQNGVFAARPHPSGAPLRDLAERGVEVLVDSFSLNERGISADQLDAGARAVDIDALVDHMVEGRKIIWH